MFDTEAILLPAPEGLEVLHDREYRVRAYRGGDDLLVIHGAVRDQKPPGLYLADDHEPLTIHHMQVALHVGFPSLEIVDAEVVFEAHPHASCTRITDHYHELIGLSIARGYTNKVRELFGGPRGCTHTTALLQAMAPVAVQCTWSMRAAAAHRGDAAPPTPEQRQVMWQSNLNTCHVWAEDGEHVASLRAGEPMEVPVFLRRRLDALGLDADAWDTWNVRAKG